ncbi:hypothetical protein DFH06DRAFT_1320833 [Mycena polygramma]|nr:hypothetical protein DFH06DRAFT_1320833 [Mycena polygramma]
MSGKGHFGLTKEHSALSDRCPAFLHAPTIICRAVGQDETPTFLEAGFTALHMEYGDSVNICYGYGNEMVQYLQPLPCLPPLHRAAGVHRKYHGVYANGTDALRLKRLEKLQELGLVRHPVVTDEVKACTDMSNDERAKSARETEVFAAMAAPPSRTLASSEAQKPRALAAAQLPADPAETNDLADAYLDRLTHLIKL